VSSDQRDAVYSQRRVSHVGDGYLFLIGLADVDGAKLERVGAESNFSLGLWLCGQHFPAYLDCLLSVYCVAGDNDDCSEFSRRFRQQRDVDCTPAIWRNRRAVAVCFHRKGRGPRASLADRVNPQRRQTHVADKNCLSVDSFSKAVRTKCNLRG